MSTQTELDSNPPTKMSSRELDNFFKNRWKAPKEFYHLSPIHQNQIVAKLKKKFVAAHSIQIVDEETLHENSVRNSEKDKSAAHHSNNLRSCSFCGRGPESTPEFKTFRSCSRCNSAIYCSGLCEKSHRMQGHRPFCGSKPPKGVSHLESDEESEEEFDDWVSKPTNPQLTPGSKEQSPNSNFIDDPENMERFYQDVEQTFFPSHPNNDKKEKNTLPNNNNNNNDINKSVQIQVNEEDKETSPKKDKRDFRVSRTISVSEVKMPANFLVPANFESNFVENLQIASNRKLV